VPQILLNGDDGDQRGKQQREVAEGDAGGTDAANVTARRQRNWAEVTVLQETKERSFATKDTKSTQIRGRSSPLTPFLL
jgi:hypothetical protein